MSAQRPGDGLSLLVAGLGSIGRRHAGNLLALGAHVSGYDPSPTATQPPGVDPHPGGLDDLDSFDGVVLATPSALHLEHLEQALSGRAKVMVEKPLAVSAAGLNSVVATGKGRIMCAFNLRFHAPVERLMSLVQEGSVGRILAVRVWSGSWLPGWRPNVDYRTTYSAIAALGGGILNDASHELDLLCWLFPSGDFRVAGAACERSGALEIDTEDVVRAVLMHDSGPVVEVALDYVSRSYRRGVEVIGDIATARLDWARQVIEIEDGDDRRTESVDVDVTASYEKEAERFCQWISGETQPPVDGEEGLRSVELADAIRAAGLRA